MKVELLSYTPNALDLLLYTKETRLTNEEHSLAEIAAWPEERKREQLRYMRGTIQSSWEFVDYVFAISGVSRAFTHQLVRTRTASFAQQSQRTVDMSGFEFVYPPTTVDGSDSVIAEAMEHVNAGYQDLIAAGEKPEVARAILPTNVGTGIIMKANLRTLADTAKTRLCFRTQGEYQQVFRLMRAEVTYVHPWAQEFMEVYCVATGTCAFPNWNGCPIKGPVFNPETGQRWDGITIARPATRNEIKAAWHRALPILAPTDEHGS